MRLGSDEDRRRVAEGVAGLVIDLVGGSPPIGRAGPVAMRSRLGRRLSIGSDPVIHRLIVRSRAPSWSSLRIMHLPPAKGNRVVTAMIARLKH